jgi:hypothetical protein
MATEATHNYYLVEHKAATGYGNKMHSINNDSNIFGRQLFKQEALPQLQQQRSRWIERGKPPIQLKHQQVKRSHTALIMKVLSSSSFGYTGVLLVSSGAAVLLVALASASCW